MLWLSDFFSKRYAHKIQDTKYISNWNAILTKLWWLTHTHTKTICVHEHEKNRFFVRDYFTNCCKSGLFQNVHGKLKVVDVYAHSLRFWSWQVQEPGSSTSVAYIYRITSPRSEQLSFPVSCPSYLPLFSFSTSDQKRGGGWGCYSLWFLTDDYCKKKIRCLSSCEDATLFIIGSRKILNLLLTLSGNGMGSLPSILLSNWYMREWRKIPM